MAWVCQVSRSSTNAIGIFRVCQSENASTPWRCAMNRHIAVPPETAIIVSFGSRTSRCRPRPQTWKTCHHRFLRRRPLRSFCEINLELTLRILPFRRILSSGERVSARPDRVVADNPSWPAMIVAVSENLWFRTAHTTLGEYCRSVFESRTAAPLPVSDRTQHSDGTSGSMVGVECLIRIDVT